MPGASDPAESAARGWPASKADPWDSDSAVAEHELGPGGLATDAEHDRSDLPRARGGGLESGLMRQLSGGEGRTRARRLRDQPADGQESTA